MWSQYSYPSLFFSPSHILSGQTVSSCPGEIQCSGHGVCSQSTYRCSCDIGWESGDCSEMACPMGPSWWDYDCILIDIQTVSLMISLNDSLTHPPTDWLTYSLTHWCTHWLTHLLTNCLIDILIEYFTKVSPILFTFLHICNYAQSRKIHFPLLFVFNHC